MDRLDSAFSRQRTHLAPPPSPSLSLSRSLFRALSLSITSRLLLCHTFIIRAHCSLRKYCLFLKINIINVKICIVAFWTERSKFTSASSPLPPPRPSLLNMPPVFSPTTLSPSLCRISFFIAYYLKITKWHVLVVFHHGLTERCGSFWRSSSIYNGQLVGYSVSECI